MKVMKFGGTSVGSPERMKQVAEIIRSEEPVLVVLSAVSGTTNKLVAIANNYLEGNKDEALSKINALKNEYDQFIPQLLKKEENIARAIEFINYEFTSLVDYSANGFGKKQQNEVLAKGEILSTGLFNLYLTEQNRPVEFLSALDFMRIDETEEPEMKYIAENLQTLTQRNDKNLVYLTQGYICRNSYGEVDNLKRGGSDYSASIIGAAIQSEEVQIWTDIDGMHNNDPRVVEKTFPVRELSFDEAAELAYFGAKILHPSTVNPAREKNIPVRLKYTMQPDAEGTLISSRTTGTGIKAIAAKDNIIAIKIKSSRMLMAYGFLRNVFEVFERYRTPIDMITTSEVAVSLTIDQDAFLQPILDELKNFGTVEVEKDQTIICMVGDLVAEKKGYAAQIFNSLSQIPVRMVSYGGSENNVSILISSQYKKDALIALNNGLF